MSRVEDDEGSGAAPTEPDSTAEEAAADRRDARRRNLVEWAVVVAGALVVAVLIKTFLVQAFYIPSQSMEPTLEVGDRVLVNKLTYKLRDPRRRDLVVFHRPEGGATTVESCDGQQITIPPDVAGAGVVDDLIKRVIAVPGETVEQRDGVVLVNGQPIDEPYLADGTRTPAFSFGTQCIRVPPGRVFVLGDNRPDSVASNRFGPIDDDSIVGRAFVRVFPLGSISTL
ncbi:MAG: signal peptidase I [Acidimicrobiia bacterium]